MSIFEWPYETGFAVTENPILAAPSCTHIRICVHVGTSLIYGVEVSNIRLLHRRTMNVIVVFPDHTHLLFDPGSNTMNPDQTAHKLIKTI